MDIKKELKHLYNAPTTPVLVEVPVMNFISIDGSGSPDQEMFQDSVQALYSVAYTIKFAVKKLAPDNDFVVPPLEGLWWTKDHDFLNLDDKTNWSWTTMIMQPDYITSEVVQQAVSDVRTKKNLPRIDDVKFGPFDEGISVQLMHIGPYSAESANITKMHEFAQESGYILNGKHHEIYLGDPRRTAPEKLKTILRQPLKKK